MLPSIDVIIVNWNAGQQLARCLASIPPNSTGLDLRRVVVVDNASTDHSAEGLDGTQLPLVVMRNQRNHGFAAACNQAARTSDADFLLFLNPDTRLFWDSLARPVRFMELPRNRETAIVGIQLVDEDGHVSRTCARFPTPKRFFSQMLGLDRVLPNIFKSHFLTEWDHQDTREVDQVMGAFFLVRRSVFEVLGGFDERFFVYLEEVDLSVRARARGWHTFFLSGVRAYHRGGGVSEQVKDVRLFYSLRSRISYAYKHFGWWSATSVTIATLFLEPFSRLALAVARGSPAQFSATIKGYALLFSSILSTLTTARPRNQA